MFWVIQEDLYKENGREKLLNTLIKFDIPYQIVKIVPFSHELIPEITSDLVGDHPIVTNGSVLLSKIANKLGWNPGGFLTDNFDYEIWYPKFKNYLLNSDAQFGNISEINPVQEEFFIRPSLDSKTFDGKIISLFEFKEWQKKIIADDDNFVKPDTRVLYASLKNVGQEYRHFVVDGKVITSSRYKLNFRPNFNGFVDQYIIDFAQKMVDIYQPARAFALDTYVSGKEQGIVEMGCIVNAGFYEIDIQKFVMAIENMNIS